MEIAEIVFADLLILLDMLEVEPDLNAVREELLKRARELEYILVLEG